VEVVELQAMVEAAQLPVVMVEEAEHPDVSEKTCNFSPSPSSSVIYPSSRVCAWADSVTFQAKP
jgi:hypothetical protein